MLAAIYNGAQFFVPADQVVGHAFHFVPGEDSPEYREDVYPQDFEGAVGHDRSGADARRGPGT